MTPLIRNHGHAPALTWGVSDYHARKHCPRCGEEPSVRNFDKHVGSLVCKSKVMRDAMRVHGWEQTHGFGRTLRYAGIRVVRRDTARVPHPIHGYEQQWAPEWAVIVAAVGGSFGKEAIARRDMLVLLRTYPDPTVNQAIVAVARLAGADAVCRLLHMKPAGRAHCLWWLDPEARGW